MALDINKEYRAEVENAIRNGLTACSVQDDNMDNLTSTLMMMVDYDPVKDVVVDGKNVTCVVIPLGLKFIDNEDEIETMRNGVKVTKERIESLKLIVSKTDYFYVIKSFDSYDFPDGDVDFDNITFSRCELDDVRGIFKN